MMVGLGVVVGLAEPLEVEGVTAAAGGDEPSCTSPVARAAGSAANANTEAIPPAASAIRILRLRLVSRRIASG